MRKTMLVKYEGLQPGLSPLQRNGRVWLTIALLFAKKINFELYFLLHRAPTTFRNKDVFNQTEFYQKSILKLSLLGGEGCAQKLFYFILNVVCTKEIGVLK